MKNKVFFRIVGLGFIALVLLFSSIIAFQYPVKNIFITSLFGESRGDHFHSGIDFGRVKDIFPIANGEVLFFSDDSDNPLIPNWGIGNYIVLEHENKVKSYYYHLKKNTVTKDLTKAKLDNKLGEMGNTGHSLGAHLHLTVYDGQKNQIINPYNLFPALKDTKKPKITNLLFRIKNKIYTIRHNARLFYYGPLEIIVTAGDYKIPAQPFYGNNVVGLKSLALFIDGELFKKYEFDYLYEKKNQLLLKGDKKIEDIYGLPHNYKLGIFEVEKSEYLFEIIVEDKNGNTNSLKKRVRFSFR